jgi:hypothetical protein
MEPVSERVTVVEKVLYKATAYFKGEPIELVSQDRNNLRNFITTYLSRDQFDRSSGMYISDLDVSGTTREVVGTESESESLIRKVGEVYRQDNGFGPSKISAIKAYRDLTGAGLKESKDAVDSLIENGEI